MPAADFQGCNAGSNPAESPSKIKGLQSCSPFLFPQSDKNVTEEWCRTLAVDGFIGIFQVFRKQVRIPHCHPRILVSQGMLEAIKFCFLFQCAFRLLGRLLFQIFCLFDRLLFLALVFVLFAAFVSHVMPPFGVADYTPAFWGPAFLMVNANRCMSLGIVLLLISAY